MQRHRILKLRNIDHCVTMDTKQECIIFKNSFKNERLAYFVLKMCGSFFYLESAVVLLNIRYLEVKIILILTINIIKNRFFFFNHGQLNANKKALGKEHWWLNVWRSIEGGQLPGHKADIHSSLCWPGRAVHFYKV